MSLRPMLPLLCWLAAGAQEPARICARMPELGQARIQRLHRGVPLWGGTCVVPLDAQGQPQVPAWAPLAVAEPSLDAEAAIARTLEDLALPFQAIPLSPPTAEAVVFPSAATGGVVHTPGPVPGTFRMDLRHSVLEEPPAEAHVPAWVVHTRHWDPLEGFMARETVVEARTGRILRKDPGVRFAGPQVPGRGLHVGSVTLEAVRLGDGRFELRDTTRPTAAHPLQEKVVGAGQGPSNVLFTRLQEGNTTRYLPFRTSSSFGDGTVFDSNGLITAERLTGPNGQTAAVDVAWGVQVTWDLLRNVLGRNGPDGQGGAVAAGVHVHAAPFAPYANAFWDPAERTVNFGDGGNGSLPFTSVDVVAHELGHALMTGTADLTYSGEPGGLDEATSDILAMGALCYAAMGATGDTLALPSGFPWAIGASLSPTGQPLRNLQRPLRSGNPDAWFEGIGLLGVYQASSPASRFFYYLSAGCNPGDTETASLFLPGGMTGIGIHKALQIWVRALQAHVQDKNTDYAGMRAATEAAATHLFGAASRERAAVQDAWAAVNVGPAAGQTTHRRLGLEPGPWPGGLGSGIHTSSSRDVYTNISSPAPLPSPVLAGFPAGTTVAWSGGFSVVDPERQTIRCSLWGMLGWSTSFEATVPGTPYKAMAMLHPVVLDLDGDGECDASDAAVLAVYSLTGQLPSEPYSPATLMQYFPPDPAIYRWNRAFAALLEVR